ncbi:MAG: TRAP transporter small permease subunit [Pseudomonadota bacterium]
MALVDDLPVMRWVRRLERVTDTLAGLGAVIIVPLMIAMVYEVVSRRLLEAPTAWAYEVSYMMMGTIFMFGMAYAMKQREHVTVDLFYARMSPRAQAIVDLIGLTLLLIVVVWLVFGLYDYMMRALTRGQRSGQSAWNPQIWPYRCVFVIGFVVLSLQTMLEWLKALLALRFGRRPSLAPSSYADEH